MTMNDLPRPIELTRPRRIEFGSGTVPTVGRWVRENGFTRTLVVADAFNAARVDQLALPGSRTGFAEIKPEPDIPNLEKLLAVAEAAEPQVIVGFGGGSAMDLAELASALPGRRQTPHQGGGAGTG